jgi:hypothetical protein
MTNVIEMMPAKTKPVPTYVFSLKDCILTVGCAVLVAYVILTGICSILMMWAVV